MAFNEDVKGIWVYRSFANTPGAVGNFDPLKVWEAELSLEVEEGGRIHGFLGERPDVATGAEPYLFVEGTVVPGNPTVVRWRARGRPQSDNAGWIYDYVGVMAPEWPDATHPRPVLVGTVTRTVAHGTSPAGAVFSFIAVKSDFVEPRVRIPLAKPVVEMIASAQHRFHHALWHASRDEWGALSDAKKAALRDLGWQPGPPNKERASRDADRLTNGSGEDFLYMHRRMVAMVRAMDPSVGSWKSLPQPLNLASFDAGTKASQIGNLDGFALPPPWIVPGDPYTTHWLAELRKDSTYYAKFQAWEAMYTDPRYIATLSLGEYGSRIEMTIHNWMHMRWTSVTRDPTTDKDRRGLPIPGGRDALDFDDKWLDPDYDFLGETFSSHVNPIFWRLHGWVDDRIDGWFQAHEAVRPGVIKRKEQAGVAWFEADAHWVLSDRPWEGPINAGMPGMPGMPGMGHDDLVLDVPTMKRALNLIYGPEPAVAPLALELAVAQVAPTARPQATWFKRDVE